MTKVDWCIFAASAALYVSIGWLLALLVKAGGTAIDEWWFHLIEVPLFLVILFWALGGFIVCWIALRRLFRLKIY